MYARAKPACRVGCGTIAAQLNIEAMAIFSKELAVIKYVCMNLSMYLLMSIRSYQFYATQFLPQPRWQMQDPNIHLFCFRSQEKFSVFRWGEKSAFKNNQLEVLLKCFFAGYLLSVGVIYRIILLLTFITCHTS